MSDLLQELEEILRSRGLPEANLLARLLSARGIGPEQLETFLDPSLKRLAVPADLPGVTEAVARLLPFVRDRRQIVVFGDYDVDGVCACAILVTVLRRLGGVADAFIPDRFEEGYGITPKSMDRLARAYPTAEMVLTVDNGINAVEEVAQLRAKGLAVIVTDHHLPGPELPQADALVNPRVAAPPDLENLCGAGVAFFLASALVSAAQEAGLYQGPKFGGPLLVLAGLATLADLMPLTGQNRILVRQAVANFRTCAPLGLRELLDRAARRGGDLTARDFGFLLAPRINAAGRMASARVSYDLLMTEDRETARNLAFVVDGHNAERKTEETRMYREAIAQYRRYLADHPGHEPEAVVVAGADWHTGVAGIVASRVLDDVHVPVCVVTGDHGSARAPTGYNVRDAFIASAETLTRFGGHAAAGGFSVRDGMLDTFRERFAAACAEQRRAHVDEIARDRNPEPDAWVEPEALSLDFYRVLQGFDPFGEGNPEPVFGLRGVMFSEIRPVGAEGRHAAFSFVNRQVPRAVWWNCASRIEDLRAHASARYDILFTLVVSDFGEPDHLELRLQDVRPATVV